MLKANDIKSYVKTKLQ